MSDIQPGDLVVHIGRAGCPAGDPVGQRRSSGLLVIGKIYRVQAVVGPDPAGTMGLVLEGIRSPHPTGGFVAWAFRKLNDEPDNIELIERIKSCRPMKTGAPA